MMMVFKPNRVKYVLSLLCAGFLGHMGVSVFENGHRSSKYIPFLTEGLSIFVLLFSILMGLSILWLLLKPHVGLYLSEQGIDESLTLFSVGELSWSEITGIREVEMGGQSALAIDVRDPNKIIENAPTALHRYIWRHRVRKMETPVVIIKYHVKSSDEIEAALKRALSHYRRTNT